MARDVDIAAEILDVIGKYELDANEAKRTLMVATNMICNIERLGKVFTRQLYPDLERDSSCGE